MEAKKKQNNTSGKVKLLNEIPTAPPKKESPQPTPVQQ